MIKRFVRYYKPHLLMFSLDMLASIAISVIGMVYPIMTNRMLNDRSEEHTSELQSHA